MEGRGSCCRVSDWEPWFKTGAIGPSRIGAPVFVKVWALIFLVGAVLTIVKWDSIATPFRG